jgi:hypothetical protein
MTAVSQDLVYAVRVLRKKPGFTLIAAMTLALGIGANTTIFSLIDGVLLRPLPYPHPERLVSLWTSYPASQGLPDIFSPPNYLDLAEMTKTFEAAGSYDNANFTLSDAGNAESSAESNAESIPGLRMSASMSRVLGITPQFGRWFTPEEDDGGRTWCC